MTIPTYKSGILQVKAYRILQMKVSQTLGTFQLNPTEWSIIGITFESSNGIRLTEIATLLNVETALITILVNKLERKKLVERYPHPTDKRAKLLLLTQKGKHLIPRVEEKLKEEMHLLLTGISEAELNTYRKVLETIIANEAKRRK